VAGVHNEDDETVRLLEARVRTAGVRGYLAHGQSRPIYSENLAVATIYETGADTGCRAHVVHCSNGRGYELCAAYRQMGHQATIEACLHYLVLCEEDLARLGAFGKVNPPIRPAMEREKLWQHLAAGNITVVSTDHVSWPLERKNLDDFHANASGAPGLEVLYPLLLQGCSERGLSPSWAARLLAQNPAQLFNLAATKGALQVGCDADVVVMEPGDHVYDPVASGHGVASWSPYAGMHLPWRVAGTWLRGAPVFDGARVLAEPGHGHFVRPVALREAAVRA
jgi:allantoinase